jgi:acyl-CoA thioesterase-2
MSGVDKPLDELLRVLDLEQIEVNIFRGESPETPLQRIFGGQVASQALIAAGRTVPEERPVHSLHAYFLRAGDPEIPVIYEVDRIRDGRSFTTRRVVAIQHGRPIFNLSASFQILEEGFEHADPMPVAPDPESLATFSEAVVLFAPEHVDRPQMPQSFDVRYVTRPPWATVGETEPPGSEVQVWMRTDGPLPDDQLVHVCAVTYASDLTLMNTVASGHGLSSWANEILGSSLDHAMWFHRTFRADEWFLYRQRSPRASGGRGLATGQIFTRSGELVVSVVQEGLIRRPRPTPS